MAFRLHMAGAFLLALFCLSVGMASRAEAACPVETVTVSVSVAVTQAPKLLVKVTLFGTEVEEDDQTGPQSLTRPAQPPADDQSQMALVLLHPASGPASSGPRGPSTCQRAVMFSFPQDRPPNAAA